jgi:hypothetical protein
MFTHSKIFHSNYTITALGTPLVLFLPKYTNSWQFDQYWGILSADGQGRFLQFVLDLTKAEIVKEFAVVSHHMSRNAKVCLSEVT